MAREFAKAFYNSKEWKDVRELVLKRDAYLCVNCGKPAEEVHHVVRLTPTNIDHVSVALNPANLISLCRACHMDIHLSDKVSGVKAKVKHVDDGYSFDENGYLIQNPPP